MSWLWAVGVVWVLLGGLLAVLIGRGIQIADRREAEAAAPNFVVDTPHPAEQAHSITEQIQSIPEQASPSSIERLPAPRESAGI